MSTESFLWNLYAAEMLYLSSASTSGTAPQDSAVFKINALKKIKC